MYIRKKTTNCNCYFTLINNEKFINNKVKFIQVNTQVTDKIYKSKSL